MKNEGFTNYDLTVLCQLFYPELVSTGQTLTELIEELSDSGLKIKVISSQPTILKGSQKVPKIIDYKGIKIVRTWSTRLNKTSFIGKFCNLFTFFVSSLFNVLLDKQRTPLFLLTNPPYLPLLGWINKSLFKVKYGVVLFDIMPEQAELLNIIKKNGFISKAWKYLNKIWYKKASYVIVLSKDMLEGAIDNTSINNKAEKLACLEKTHIVHIWSDDRIITPICKSESIFYKSLNLEQKLVVQYSGNHGRFHDIETILEIALRLKNDEDFIFQFIGEGLKKKLVDDYIEKYNLKNIISSSYVPKEQLSDSLAAADIGVIAQLPGQERVCYPSKLLGIMASGRPVFAICPINTEISQMIIQNNLGFVVNNNDVVSGIEKLLQAKENPGLLEQMGQNSLSYLKSYFTLVSASEQYYQIIKNN